MNDGEFFFTRFGEDALYAPGPGIYLLSLPYKDSILLPILNPFDFCTAY